MIVSSRYSDDYELWITDGSPSRRLWAQFAFAASFLMTRGVTEDDKFMMVCSWAHTCHWFGVLAGTDIMLNVLSMLTWRW